MNFDIEDEEQEELEEQENKKAKKLFSFDKKNKFIYIGIGAVILLIILIIILSSVSSKKKQQSNVKPSEPVVIKKQGEQQSKINVINENSNDRPIAIVSNGNIDNVKPAGLQDSYINYEIINEYGTTKILSLYKDKKVGLIGPVVNLKSYLIDYAIEHDAILAYFGSDDQTEQEVSEFNICNLNGKKNTSSFVRDKSLTSPNDIFTSTNRVKNFVESNNKSTTSETWKVFNYSTTEVLLNNKDIKNSNGEKEKIIAAEKIVINYSQSEVREYDYSSDNKYYLRKTNGANTLDRVTNNQLHYKNIIIIKVEMQNNNGIQVPKTVGTGNGYYITNGLAVPITWSKQSRNTKTKYTYANGTEIELNDGNTFVQIVPVSNNISIGKEK